MLASQFWQCLRCGQVFQWKRRTVSSGVLCVLCIVVLCTVVLASCHSHLGVIFLRPVWKALRWWIRIIHVIAFNYDGCSLWDKCFELKYSMGWGGEKWKPVKAHKHTNSAYDNAKVTLRHCLVSYYKHFAHSTTSVELEKSVLHKTSHYVCLILKPNAIYSVEWITYERALKEWPTGVMSIGRALCDWQLGPDWQG